MCDTETSYSGITLVVVLQQGMECLVLLALRMWSNLASLLEMNDNTDALATIFVRSKKLDKKIVID